MISDMTEVYRPGRSIGSGEKFDVLVIGSGIGGMSAASLLARSGKRVLILEQHYVPGGFTHTFTRKSYEWDVGFHYLGEVHQPQNPLRRLFDFFRTESSNGVGWEFMGNLMIAWSFRDRRMIFWRAESPLSKTSHHTSRERLWRLKNMFA